MKRLIPLVLTLAMTAGCQDLPTAEVRRPFTGEIPDPTGTTSRCASSATPPCKPVPLGASYDNANNEMIFVWEDLDSLNTRGFNYEIVRNAAGTDTAAYIRVGLAADTLEFIWPEKTGTTDGFVKDSIWEYDFRMRVQQTTVGVSETWSGYSDSYTTTYGTPDKPVISIDSVGTDFVRLSWTEPTNLTGLNGTYVYSLRVTDDAGDWSDLVVFCNCTTYRDTGLSREQWRGYRVHLRYTMGPDEYGYVASDQRSATTK